MASEYMNIFLAIICHKNQKKTFQKVLDLVKD